MNSAIFLILCLACAAAAAAPQFFGPGQSAGSEQGGFGGQSGCKYSFKFFFVIRSTMKLNHTFIFFYFFGFDRIVGRSGSAKAGGSGSGSVGPNGQADSKALASANAQNGGVAFGKSIGLSINLPAFGIQQTFGQEHSIAIGKK